MIFNILTLFPEILRGYFESSIMARAVQKDLINYKLIDFRNYAHDRHRTCDDSPYGGGAGMVIKPEPLGEALETLESEGNLGHVIYMSPSGAPLTQQRAEKLADISSLTIICGRYEGIDQRIIDKYVDEEISIGDYVLSSGEIASLVLVDAVYRLKEGVINGESLEEESFEKGLLEYPHYTRPFDYKGMKVPDILLSGNHKKIEEWRLDRSVRKTLSVRPDLLNADLDPAVLKLLNAIRQEEKDNGFN